MTRGLTAAEVQDRIAKGQLNKTDQQIGKSVREIILSNTITFFNLLNIGFFVLVIIAGSYKNGLFMFVIIINTVIGIIQELRTKKKLDSLRILTASRITVIRDGKEQVIEVTDIVLDDVMLLKTGDEIPSDATVLSGEIEVNESLLTGESDNIAKKKGDSLLSGAFVTSGRCEAVVVHVGKDNYVEQISAEARKFKQVESELKNSVNLILKRIAIIIVPLVAMLFAKNYFVMKRPFESCVVQSVTSGIGMIPEGLVLLTSVALTLGVLRLAKQRVVVQELYCIEALARVDVLCLDKTGTLTEGSMNVEDAIPLTTLDELNLAFQNLMSAEESKNATSLAITDYFGTADKPWEVEQAIPFSSDRKYSGASFKGHGAYFLGAVQFLLPHDNELLQKTEAYASKGMRVLVLAHADALISPKVLPPDLKPIGYIALSDVIRKDCRETLEFFKKQGVALKCISGDDPLTVSKIAQTCGLDGAEHYVDARMLKTKQDIYDAVRKYTVFGRVRPEQKKMMVECLQEQEHTVAMTGDGVNDVLALKQADCAIAMASGSEATKHAAHIVLLDSDFTAMPSVVKEGRRVINNICNAAAMYLIKTTFSVLITIGTILFGSQYPFQAVQLSIISGCAVGAPTFFLQMEPSFMRIEKNFMRRIVKNAVPAGILIALLCLLLSNIGIAINEQNAEMMSTICVLCIGWIYFFMLQRVYSPMTAYRRFVVYAMQAVYLIIMIVGQHILVLTSISTAGVLVLLFCVTLTPPLIDLIETTFDRVMRWRDERKALVKGEEDLPKAA
ncbi:MAG: HAD-IC family P-type ATPase [Lachnospiraceae bacterium]|nr:HAD-IC family P-type ATPase [Lachnospiraceae bacterium]